MQMWVLENLDSIFFYQETHVQVHEDLMWWNLPFTLGSKPLGKLSKCFDMVIKVVFFIDNTLEPMIIREFWVCTYIHVFYNIAFYMLHNMVTMHFVTQDKINCSSLYIQSWFLTNGIIIVEWGSY